MKLSSISKHISNNYSCIYKIKNSITNKIYIGSAVCLVKRIYQHLSRLRNGTHHSIKLQNSWNLHGEGSFTVEILQPVINIDNLISIEQYWLDKTQSYVNGIGYNVSTLSGRVISFGPRHTEESKAKLSQSRKRAWEEGVYNDIGIKISTSLKNKYINTPHPNKGVKRKPEHIAKSVAARKINIENGKTINYWSGKKRSKETCKKLSDAHKGKKLPPTHPFVTRDFKKPSIIHTEESKFRFMMSKKDRIRIKMTNTITGESKICESKRDVTRYLISKGEGKSRLTKNNILKGKFKHYKIEIL